MTELGEDVLEEAVRVNERDSEAETVEDETMTEESLEEQEVTSASEELEQMMEFGEARGSTD